MNKEAQTVADIYLKDPAYNDPFDLAKLISERVDYYSDRWSDNGVRFEVIRILLNECEKRWKQRSKCGCECDLCRWKLHCSQCIKKGAKLIWTKPEKLG